ncbi:hypothetical protein FOXG_21357 [Fusarium oxysporum f. sp. lycopersici 4287]|uniref:Uncharacterized protein n=1 Tax=Fusarium oxysporum f. sp. lycopersici (strain 4287 / CBS 123668 / FGSC 9935 / NRRL 34936) TaxID=426428 RepID=A0A0J9VX04_FUSO4|nr:hypothetical protein FOXG_20950 [Fusarium oxysporum f. sp. lycopersici 4287]XP_018253559.1 hypothetical protein FOXG_21357 [Fusarium oxysporum f. sp. lycopersici 4287]EWZ78186.1 hypothetical protein FOWG_17488 [Fusarium oxysporum f. sp. lycopersici MN25]KNB13846.1 hypothetical protein FOXG_20950 [Fusarium oxysporum f. sp. lycopersici 4287]KNB15514.1 hypothetical protein FOXG_21357 [Fusarium oxysporum f. sp. lycopersici 4287]
MSVDLKSPTYYLKLGTRRAPLRCGSGDGSQDCWVGLKALPHVVQMHLRCTIHPSFYEVRQKGLDSGDIAGDSLKTEQVLFLSLVWVHL